MPATHLFLVRHGESTGNAEQRFTGWMPVSLSERGLLQAQSAGLALVKHGPFDAILCSDLLRARQTAHAIARELSFPIEQIQERRQLRERDLGIFTGMTFEDAKQKHPDLWEPLMRREFAFTPPEGESNQQVSDRVQEALNEVVASYAGKRVLLVSHGIALSHLIRLLLRIDETHYPRWISFHSENASIHRILLREDGGCAVLALNETYHLAGI